MTKVIFSEDCGNSPKNIFVQDFTIALAKADSRFIPENVTEDVRWNILGNQHIQGKEQLIEALKLSKLGKVAELTIQHVATHGKAGAVNGIKKLANGKTVGFCDFYEFGDTKGTLIKEITTYQIEIK
jgi:hypothetical protein